MVKIEGTLDEIKQLFSASDMADIVAVSTADTKRRLAGKPAGAIPRKKSAWQIYMGQKKFQIKFKSGKRKGQLDLKRMGVAFRKSNRGKK